MRPLNTKWIIVGALAVAVIGGGTTIAIASSSGGDDSPLTGSALAKAKAAALAYTGGGTLVETEVGDDGSAYSVEVRLADGRQVEVTLDASFSVIGTETDDDGQGDEGEPGGN